MSYSVLCTSVASVYELQFSSMETWKGYLDIEKQAISRWLFFRVDSDPRPPCTVPKWLTNQLKEHRLFCNLQVQEIPQDEFQDQNLYAGPILRVLCSSRATFLEPVTIQLPVPLGNKLVNLPQPSECRVRIFFLSPERETKEWVEISDKLENPASYDGRLVKFKVERFSGYVYRWFQKLKGFRNIYWGVRLFDNRRNPGDRKWFEPRSYIPRWNFIVRVKGVLKRAVVRDWCFNILSGCHLQSQVTVENSNECSNALVWLWLVARKVMRLVVEMVSGNWGLISNCNLTLKMTSA